MGRLKRWGASYKQWFLGLTKFQKYLVSLGMVTVAVYGVALLVAPVYAMMFKPEEKVVVWCDPQGRKTVDGVETPKVTISRDDPRFDESDLDATMFRLCALM